MSIGGLIFFFIMLIGVIVVVAMPLLARPLPPARPEDPLIARQRQRLGVYYDRVLANLRDLDEDHALGKIEPALYAADRALWVERGIQALKALDTLEERALIDASAIEDSAIDHAIAAAVEIAIQQAKQETA